MADHDPTLSARQALEAALTDEVLNRALEKRADTYLASLRLEVSTALLPAFVALRQERDEARAMLICDVCNGKGRVDETTGCVCEGAGTITAALTHSREWLLRLTKRDQEHYADLDMEKARADQAESRLAALEGEIAALRRACSAALGELWATYGENARTLPLLIRLENALPAPPSPSREP